MLSMIGAENQQAQRVSAGDCGIERRNEYIVDCQAEVAAEAIPGSLTNKLA